MGLTFDPGSEPVWLEEMTIDEDREPDPPRHCENLSAARSRAKQLIEIQPKSHYRIVRLDDNLVMDIDRRGEHWY